MLDSFSRIIVPWFILWLMSWQTTEFIPQNNTRNELQLESGWLLSLHILLEDSSLQFSKLCSWVRQFVIFTLQNQSTQNRPNILRSVELLAKPADLLSAGRNRGTGKLWEKGKVIGKMTNRKKIYESAEVLVQIIWLFRLIYIR